MDKDGTIVFGIPGGIAAYKCCEITRLLVRDGFDVHCVLTKAGAQFITPLTLQTLSGNPVHTELFNLIEETSAGHISLADRADAVLIAPATADVIAKISHGICDDLLTAVVCATRAPVLLSPSMNSNMWKNPITQENVSRLKKLEYKFIEPDEGMLACGYEGKGRLPEPAKIVGWIKSVLK